MCLFSVVIFVMEAVAIAREYLKHYKYRAIIDLNSLVLLVSFDRFVLKIAILQTW